MSWWRGDDFAPPEHPALYPEQLRVCTNGTLQLIVPVNMAHSRIVDIVVMMARAVDCVSLKLEYESRKHNCTASRKLC